MKRRSSACPHGSTGARTAAHVPARQHTCTYGGTRARPGFARLPTTLFARPSRKSLSRAAAPLPMKPPSVEASPSRSAPARGAFARRCSTQQGNGYHSAAGGRQSGQISTGNVRAVSTQSGSTQSGSPVACSLRADVLSPRPPLSTPAPCCRQYVRRLPGRIETPRHQPAHRRKIRSPRSQRRRRGRRGGDRGASADPFSGRPTHGRPAIAA